MKLINNIKYLKKESKTSWNKLSIILDIPLKTLETYYLKKNDTIINPELTFLIKFRNHFKVNLEALVFTDLSITTENKEKEEK